MELTRRRSFPFLLILPLLLVVGCAHVSTEKGSIGVVATSEAFKNFTGEYENTAYFVNHKPVSIAVLPFHYSGSKSYSIERAGENPAEIVRRGMYNHVSSLPFSDLEIYDIDRRLKNAGLTDFASIRSMLQENPRRMKSLLGVDAVVLGEVTHFDRIFLGIYSQVAVGCEVRMLDLASGELLWRAKQVSRAHAGGLSMNPIGLALATVASVWNLRESEMLGQTDELFREVISTISLPQSVLLAQPPAPRIDLFAAMNTGKPFRVGQPVAFRVVGDPGCSAYVDLGDFKYGVALAPVPASVKTALHAEVLEVIKKNYQDTGHTLTPELIAAVRRELDRREIYEGQYVVEPMEEAYGLLSKAYLVNPAGAQGTALDAVHTVDIDSRPPGVVAGLTAESLDRKVRLNWTAGTESDLTGYEIWSSTTPLSGYSPAAKSEKNEVILAGLPNFTNVYLQVRAVDRADNKGRFSRPIEAAPLPEPGLYDLPQPGPVLDGEIRQKILLVADKNPYSVISGATIVKGGAVYVAPGVEIRFGPDAALTVRGGDLLAFGRKDRPIRLVPRAADSRPGAWQGVALDSAGRCVFTFVTIEKAVTGLTIVDSAPAINAVTVERSSQAGLHLKDRARPDITCSLFKANEGQGGVVIQGEGIAPVIRHNVFEENAPFQVQSHTPLSVDFSENYWGRPNPQPDSFLGNVVWEPFLAAPAASCEER